MADSIQSLSDLADRATLVNNQDTVDADEHNTTRTAVQNQVNLLNDVVQEQDKNYASPTEPTLKSEGKIWCDTTNDPAVIKFYKDSSANTEELVGTTQTQTLTNKTLTNPTFSPVGAKAYLGLQRDLNLKITNNSTNSNYQIDITFEYLTLYDTNGRGAVESRTSALTLDVSGTGAGGRAASENSGAEQASVWYYIYVYSDGAGTLNGLLAQASTWADVITNTDNPSGSDYVRRIGAVRNDSGGNFLAFHQINDFVGVENDTGGQYNLGTTSSSSWVSTDISSLVPSGAVGIAGWVQQNSSGYAYISPRNSVAPSTNHSYPGGISIRTASGSNILPYYCEITEDQTVYIASEGTNTSKYSLNSFKIVII